ncbi:MAG: VOC family protein [Proteobacteria bacterium]|nr:VOC family protein [Pseudomonadota bacterium]
MTSASQQIRPVLDHAVVNVRAGLDDAVAQFSRLGFHLTERGHHSLGSSNHLAVFGSDYLELLGFMPENEGKRPDLLTHPLGLTGLAFRADDPAMVYDILRARGLPALEPLPFQRPVALPDGTSADARFTIVRFPAGTVPNGRSFFCHHHTPELVWRPEWQVHRNGALGVAEFAIAAHEPSRTAALYEAMFGSELMALVPGGVAFTTPALTLLILTPDAVAQRYNGAALVSPDGSDRMVALGIAVRSLDTARAVLDGEGVPYTALPSGGIVVPHAQAGNVALAFVER